MKPSPQAIASQVASALAEDMGSGDVSSGLIAETKCGEAAIYCREQAVLCGIDWCAQSFLQLDHHCQVRWLAQDGDKIGPDQKICSIFGAARSLLSGERTALNFLQTLSAVATRAADFAQLTAGTGVCILDTRKTIPGLRLAQKYAVSVGGCNNHRFGLYDAVLIKENHIASSQGITDLLSRAKKIAGDLLIEIEVENLDQLCQAIEAGVDRIMLDNFSLENIRKAVDLAGGRVELEVSGNLDEDQLPELIATGIDYVSIGAITKHVKAIDFSMRFQEKPSKLI